MHVIFGPDTIQEVITDQDGPLWEDAKADFQRVVKEFADRGLAIQVRVTTARGTVHTAMTPLERRPDGTCHYVFGETLRQPDVVRVELIIDHEE